MSNNFSENNEDNSNSINDEEKYFDENCSMNVTYEDIDTCNFKFIH